MSKDSSVILFNQTPLLAKKNSKKSLDVIKKVLASGIYLNGVQNKILEKNLKNFLGVRHIALTASGHDSLLLALQSLKLKKTDEVIFPVNAYPTAFPVVLAGVTPVPVDVDMNGQLDPERVAEKITRHTRAIILVHLYGLVGNMNSLLQISRAHNVILIEDCAQSFGTRYKNKMVGTFGDISCFSFYPTKNLPALGDGGALITHHKMYHQYVQMAKSYGENTRYNSEFIAGHSRLPEIQAGVLNQYFKTLDTQLKKREKIAHYYIQQLKQKKVSRYIRVLESNTDSQPIHHLLVIEAKNRNRLRTFLKKKNIETFVHYPTPVHLVPAFSYLNFKNGDFPNAEHLAKTILSLPFHQYLTKKSVRKIVTVIREFYD